MMRKFVVLLSILVLFCAAAAIAQVPENGRGKEAEQEIAKIQAEITRLETKLKGAGSEAKRVQLVGLINGQQARLDKLKAELAPPDKKEEPVRRDARFKFEIGGSTGIFAGTTGVLGELRFDLNRVFGAATTSLRLSGGYFQSEDASRRFAPVNIDGILNFPPDFITGVENYIGAGVNYLFRTTGPTSGTIGGEVFYGIQGNGFNGKIFGEMGYGVLRTGFTPDYQGLTLLVGYRTGWSI